MKQQLSAQHIHVQNMCKICGVSSRHGHSSRLLQQTGVRCDAGAAFSKHLDLGPSVILIFVFMLIGILHVEYINKTVFKLSISIQMNPHLSLTMTYQLEFTSRNRNYICKRFIKSRPPTMWSQWL